MPTETIPANQVIWQGDERMNTYECPFCHRFLFTQYIGTATPLVKCAGPMEDHILTWPEVKEGKARHA